MKAQILTEYEIVKKTENALLISTPMIIGKKGTQNREFWMPKSQVKVVDEGLAIATWLILKNESIKYRTFFESVARVDEGRIKTINV